MKKKMMEKHKRELTAFWHVVCIALIFIMMLALLSACGGGGLSGTYRSDDLVGQSFTFRGDEVTMSAFGINASGSYRIEGDSIAITYSLFGLEYTWRQSFSRSGSDLYIGGTRFVKQ